MSYLESIEKSKYYIMEHITEAITSGGCTADLQRKKLCHSANPARETL